MTFKRPLLLAASTGSALLLLAACGGSSVSTAASSSSNAANPASTPNAQLSPGTASMGQVAFARLSRDYLAAATTFAGEYAAACVDGGDVVKCQTSVSNFSTALKTWTTTTFSGSLLEWPTTAGADASAVGTAVTTYSDSLVKAAAATTIAEIKTAVDQANTSSSAAVTAAFATLAHDVGLAT